MRTIIAGSRTLGYSEVCKAMNTCGWIPSVVLSGAARGVDIAGEHWAAELNIPVERYLADWNKYGKRAGPIRNAQMGDRADALVAVWDGASRGTHHMIQYARNAGLRVHVWSQEDYLSKLCQ